jgi:branched-chain amino acid aminotransferase
LDAWWDGKFVGWNQVCVSPLSHGFSRGVVIFEVTQVIPTRKGPAFLCLDEHIDRFFNSALLLHMDLGLTKPEIARACLDTAKHNQVEGGICKFFAYFSSPEIFPVPKDRTVSLSIYTGDYAVFGFDPQKIGKPLSAAVTSYKKLHPQTVPIKAKVAGSYVGAYLAAVEMAEQGYDDPLFVDLDGFVSEGPTHNVFFIKDGVILTPPLARVLTGTTRGMVIQVARDLGYQVDEVDIRPEELSQFDEAFCSSCMSPVTPFSSIDGQPLGSRCPGPVTAALEEHFKKVYQGDVPEHSRWLTWVD